MPTEPTPSPPTDGPAGTTLPDVLHLLDRAARGAGGRARSPEAVEAFGRAALRRVAANEMAMADPALVAAELLHAYDSLEDRPPRQAAVEVRPVAPSWFGPEGGRATVEVAAEDRPLLFSTVMAALGACGLRVRRYSHPILGVQRDADGHVTTIGPPLEPASAEVLIHVEVAEELDAARAATVGEELVGAIAEAVVADQDGAAMRSVVAVAADRLLGEVAPVPGSAEPTYDTDTRTEVAGFCRWLLARNFLFVGLQRGDGTRLGTCPDEVGPSRRPVEELDPTELFAPGPLVVRRSTLTSRVSRRERLAELLVADVDDHGELAGVIRVLGLTTLRGRSERPSGVPWLRRKLRTALDREQVVPGSHDETVLTALFDDLPWDVLLMADPAWIRAALVQLLEGRQSSRAVVLALPEQGSSAFTVVVAHPADHDRPRLRAEVERYLVERYRPESLEVIAELGSSGMWMLSVVVGTDPVPGGAGPDLGTLVEDLLELSRSWTDLLAVELRRRRATGRALVARWIGQLPPGYREATTPAVAAEDLVLLDQVDGTGALRVRVLDGAEGARGPEDLLHLRLVVGGPPPELSRLVPVLESTGLRIAEDMTFALGDDGGARASVLDLAVRAPVLGGDDPARLADAVLASWQGEAEVDPLNALVLTGGLTWEQVAVLRAYARYLRQVRPGTSTTATEEALVHNPEVAVALWRRFEARFRPASPDDTSPAAWDEPSREAVVACCDRVARLDQDRLLRDLGTLVDATVRTNAFARTRSGAITLALDGSRLPGTTRARTWRELWVTSPTVEGVHLRAGPVARGGLRWSDRTGDLRTEVLQLMSAQELKNALIVPTGAKGGFVLRRRPSDPTELREGVRAAYSTFVRSLLDVVDDLDHGEVVHPDGVCPADDEDSYLVVAADRGTASFSDLANSFAEERGFWLGDAFASGGSAGYDHKALGVTARGAWVSVAEHFERLGTDVSRDPFTAVGVGDMSGDVFGNGMLLSASMRLVAAFDHRHVFVDPDPDPERALAERRRLFELPRSSWNDYDRTVLSPGGMIVPRSAKRVRLTPEVRALLELSEDEPTLPDLVRAVLCAPTDLLYFGGIGTFVRAGDESDAAVGDAANDEVRVAASALRARVVVEGANLAVTPQGRVDFAGAGGLINSDAVDNSAGVDSSDHEVNLKILLGLAERDGLIDRPGRDARLAAAAGEVVASVLGNVAKQNRALTRAAASSAGNLEPFLSLMFALEAEGRVDREVHALPAGAEVRRRREAREGLRRPELAVIMAATKEWLAGLALGSELPDRPPLQELAAQALPASVTAEFGELLGRHPLRRAIVASRLANEVVDRMGMTWVSETSRRSGASEVTVMAAYWMARQTARLRDWWRAIDDAPLSERHLVWDPAVEVIDALAGDYLRRGTAAAFRWDEVERSARAAEVLTPPGPDLGGADDLRRLALAAGLADVARRSGRTPTEAVDVFLDAGERFGIDRLTWALMGCRLDPDDTWAQRHRDSLLFDVDRLRRAAALAMLDPVARARVEHRLEEWSDRLDEAIAAGTDDLHPLAVVVAELWLLVEDLGGEIPRA